jgi:hypothetical protein
VSVTVESSLALVEVCADVSIDHPGHVGLVAAPRDGKAWVKLTPAEARKVAADLVEAADETEASA